MRGDSQGIQQLLSAEKRADEKIGHARKHKAARLKQAKEEAQSEIKKFRAEKEKLFKEYESNFLGSREDHALKIENETVVKINELHVCIAENKDEVIQQLLSKVYDIKPMLHVNVRGA